MASFLAIGTLIVIANVLLPAAFERVTEGVVASMLIGLGGWQVLRQQRVAQPSGAVMLAKPVGVGVIHGLAGSAGIALIAAATIESRALATAYLALVALGTVLGMVVLTLALTWPMGWAIRRPGITSTVVVWASALLSIGLGVSLLVESFAAG